MKRINSTKYDILAVWDIISHCNFNCKYCFKNLEEKENKKFLNLAKINKAINFFNKSKFRFLIHMTGGEPFLHPKFVEICKSLTKKHYISISTNLSTHLINDFIKEINPKRVEAINCSLHISEREKLNLKEDFIRKFNDLKESGFNVFANQVMYPEDLKRFDKVFKYFKHRRIIIFPKVFRGIYKKKEYPEAYTKNEEEKLLILRRESSKQKIKNKNLVFQYYNEPINGKLSFKDSLCSAGRKFIIINNDGIIRRCLDENNYMGNIFKGEFKPLKEDKICTAKICHCPYSGLVFASGDPKLITEPPITKFLKRFIYPYTTPFLRPLRKNFQKIFLKIY